jgi:diguanylate cyclase (GGDEF)-like protein
MKRKMRALSLVSRGLKYKLRIAACLMSVLPLLILGYLVSYHILPQKEISFEIIAPVFIVIFIALIGFWVVKEVFDRIVSVSSAAKLIAAGDTSHILEVERPDEVGDLSQALNQLTQRIRSNMDELKNYSEKTTEINLGIQRRIIMLSSLLQVSSLISQGAKLDETLKLAVEKTRLLADSDLACLFFRRENKEEFVLRAADGINAQYLAKVILEPAAGALFDRLITSNRPLLLDKQNTLPDNIVAAIYDKFRLKNMLAMPVYLRGRVEAVIGIGNARGAFNYSKDDIEALDIFAKQIAIALENDILVHRVEKLEIKDALTGLYNEAFISSRLQEEIKRAVSFQRPCAFIAFDVDNFKRYQQDFGSLQVEAALRKIGSLIRDSVTEIDRVARSADDEFAVVLPEKNKRQAQEVAETIRKKIEFSFSEEENTRRRLTVSAGVSENPLDGVEARELVARARELVAEAKKRGKNCVV